MMRSKSIRKKERKIAAKYERKYRYAATPREREIILNTVNFYADMFDRMASQVLATYLRVLKIADPELKRRLKSKVSVEDIRQEIDFYRRAAVIIRGPFHPKAKWGPTTMRNTIYRQTKKEDK